ncbi:TIGR00725 family protein [Frankia sp. AgB32]|uniref:TIGR00725 family protein n=1 Tax=Frankia sp. AgB32 TaxID=631119 RepID=UPI00200DF5FC|nr:TIGR00725 family protein [Frankia sp. AgB32]MCK9894164.1 TIGR00725 family protein [Frankia sp. AgB32]
MTRDTDRAARPGPAAVTTYIGVVGPSTANAAQRSAAEIVGRRLAEQGWAVVCGGLGGVMAAACRGAAVAGGMTIGLLPGLSRAAGNEHLTVSIPTGLGELRNGLLVRATDALVAVGGSWGTLSEIAFALRTGRPVVGLDTWTVSPRTSPTGPAGDTLDTGLPAIIPVASPEEVVDAVRTALSRVRGQDSGTE